jgi:hypothetical protein
LLEDVAGIQRIGDKLWNASARASRPAELGVDDILDNDRCLTRWVICRQDLAARR